MSLSWRRNSGSERRAKSPANKCVPLATDDGTGCDRCRVTVAAVGMMQHGASASASDTDRVNASSVERCDQS